MAAPKIRKARRTDRQFVFRMRIFSFDIDNAVELYKYSKNTTCFVTLAICQQMFNFVKTVFCGNLLLNQPPLALWFTQGRSHWHSAEVFIDVHENYQKEACATNTKYPGHHYPIHSFRKGKHQQQNIRDVKYLYDQPRPVCIKRPLDRVMVAPIFEHYADSLFFHYLTNIKNSF